MASRPPYLNDQKSLVVLKSLFGSLKLTVVFLIILTLILLSWTMDSWLMYFMDLLGDGKKTFNTQKLIFIGVVSILLVLWLCFITRRAHKSIADVRVSVNPELCPQRYRAMIIFLSEPRCDIENIDFSNLGHINDLNNDSPLNDSSWRMPLEAIKYHLARLSFLVVIPSTDTVDDVGSFKKIVTQMTEGKVDVICLSSIDEKNCEKGINFDNMDEVVAATENAYNYLSKDSAERKRVAASNDIIVDITSGTKTSSVAGAITCLAEKRQFQYVKCDKKNKSYHVITFDVSYDLSTR